MWQNVTKTTSITKAKPELAKLRVADNDLLKIGKQSLLRTVEQRSWHYQCPLRQLTPVALMAGSAPESQ